MWGRRPVAFVPPASRLRGAGRAVAAPPPLPRRRTLRDALRPTDAKQAARAARPLLEFIEAQERLAAAPSRTRRRTLADRQRHDRLWLEPDTYVAWTIDGHLVAIQERGPTLSPLVSRLSDEQRRVLFSFEVLVPTVIALYRGDQLGRSSITRFIPHFDLAAAHRAARERELAAIAAEVEPETEAPPPATAARPVAAKPLLKKSRFHPEGNFVLIAPAPTEAGLPEFAVIQPLAPPRRAFETKRQAERAASRMLRLGHTSTRFVPARVIGAVEARLRFRPDIDLPKDPERRLELLRREPRIVLPELEAAWLPRFVQVETGEWVPQRFSNRRTVRSKLNEQLVRELGDASASIAAAFDAADLRRRLRQAARDVTTDIEAALRVALRAQRRLPSTWLEGLGMEREMLGPDWRDLAGRRHEPPREEGGHWLRAPVECGERHPDGLRSRIVELRIDDLAGLIEVAGWRPVFWLVKKNGEAGPRWTLPA